MSDDKKKPAHDATALRAAAVKALIEAHKEEFDGLLDAQYDKVGAKRIVRKSAEERAEEKKIADAARAEAKEAARREKALATARALAHEFPEFLALKEPEAEFEPSGFDEFAADPFGTAKAG